jgi:hypothetical protein
MHPPRDRPFTFDQIDWNPRYEGLANTILRPLLFTKSR